MALHYIVDGYNVIKKTTFLNHKKLQDARDSLLSFVYIHRPQSSHNNQITVIFDGREDVFNYKQNYDFGIFFTRNESAANRIKSMIEKAPNPKNIVVVSEDKVVKLYCRSRGTRIFSVDDFLKKGKDKTKKSESRK